MTSAHGARRAECRRRRVGTSIASILGVVVGSLLLLGESASAASVNLVVNSTAWGGADISPGNGQCDSDPSAATVCTLRAAIEEANALAGAPGDITITVSDSIPLNTRMTGTPNALANRMTTTAPDTQDAYGAAFHVVKPVTIDLGHRLQPNAGQGPNADAAEQALFFLDGPDISVLNADDALASGTSFVVGPNAKRVTIDGGGGSISTAAGWAPERFVVFREGASDATVKNYTVSGYYDSVSEGGLFVFNARAPYTPMTNIVVSNVNVKYLSGTTCSGSDGSGCRTRLTNFWRDGGTGTWTGNTINGLTFRDMTVENLTNQYAFQLGAPGDTSGTNSADITDLVIRDNLFKNVAGMASASPDYAFVKLPYGAHLGGTSSITGNKFLRANAGVGFAISYEGNKASGSTAASGLTIADNYFNNYPIASVRTYRSGLVSVLRNTFGTTTNSQPRAGVGALPEEYADTSVMYNTFHGSSAATSGTSNQSIRTWAPTAAATVLTGAAPAGALTMTPPTSAPTCLASVPVSRITATDNSSQAPGTPVTLQAYWTSDDTAEIYLGSVTGVTGSSANLLVPLPMGNVTLPDGPAQAVNSSTGVASGFVRLQTHVEGMGQLESSQYSRVVALSGSCVPVLTLQQATGQNDATLARDLHFTLTSSVALDTSSVTPGDFGLTGTATADTFDAARINQRVVSVTPVPGTGGRQFDIVVRADDSARVTIALPSGRVAATSGLTNATAANAGTTGVDDQITFVNPLTVAPTSLTIITGEATGQSFAISTKAGAPVPSSGLDFTTTVTQPGGSPTLVLSDTTPQIGDGLTTSGPVQVTAEAGAVTAGTQAKVAFAVTSTDTNYDGLVVPSVTAALYSTSPAIQIVKTAYTGMTSTGTPAQIESTGTLVPTGSRLSDGQSVCFVYTVTNTSQDDWATSLKNVRVTDTDQRLGDDGLVGTIARLAVGEVAKVSACTSLAPVDTTVDKVPGS